MRSLALYAPLLFAVTACDGPVPSVALQSAEASPAIDAPAAPDPMALANPTLSFAPLVDALSPAVVNVEVTKSGPSAALQEIPDELRQFFGIPEDFQGEGGGLGQPSGAGSGFVISADGYILTNHHVIADASAVRVVFDDERALDAAVVGSDERIDVALLKVEADGLPWVELGESEPMRVGDWVLAIGNPYGLGHTVTAGIISGKGRALGAGPYDDFLQTDAAINPGNSGGPLFNLQGQVIGINTAIVAQANSIGFTIPVDMVEEILDDLKTDGRVARGWLGVSVQSITPEIAAAMSLSSESGALISEAHPGAPAHLGGVRAGDVVIELGGESIDDNTDLIQTIGRHRAGETVALTVIREGAEREIDVTLGERPPEDALRAGLWEAPRDEPPATKSAPNIGVSLQDTPDGVVVGAIEDGSAAAEVLQPGDVLLQLNHRPIRSARQATEALTRSKDAVLLLIQRDGREIFLPLEIS